MRYYITRIYRPYIGLLLRIETRQFDLVARELDGRTSVHLRSTFVEIPFSSNNGVTFQRVKRSIFNSVSGELSASAQALYVLVIRIDTLKQNGISNGRLGTSHTIVELVFSNSGDEKTKEPVKKPEKMWPRTIDFRRGGSGNLRRVKRCFSFGLKRSD